MQQRDKFFNALVSIRSTAAIAEAAASGQPAIIDGGTALDAASMRTVREALTSNAREGRWNYVLDLSRVTAIDSSGLGMLISALRSLRDAGGSIGLVTASPNVQRILELCARRRSCRIFARTADAVAALTRSSLPRSAA